MLYNITYCYCQLTESFGFHKQIWVHYTRRKTSQDEKKDFQKPQINLIVCVLSPKMILIKKCNYLIAYEQSKQFFFELFEFELLANPKINKIKIILIFNEKLSDIVWNCLCVIWKFRYTWLFFYHWSLAGWLSYQTPSTLWKIIIIKEEEYNLCVYNTYLLIALSLP